MRMDVVPVEYGIFAQIFHFTMWFFQFITGINFEWNYVMWRIISLLVCIGLWTKSRIYRVHPHPVRWSCWDFGSVWRAFMLIWMLWSKNDLNVSHRKQVNDPANMKLETSLVNFECKPCGIFAIFSYHQEDEAIDPTIFAAAVGLRDRMKKLFPSNFMGMVSSVLVIFYT